MRKIITTVDGTRFCSTKNLSICGTLVRLKVAISDFTMQQVLDLVRAGILHSADENGEEWNIFIRNESVVSIVEDGQDN